MTEYRPPFTVESGRVTVEPSGEIWVRKSDEVQEISRRIWFALQAGRPYVDVAVMGAAAVNQAMKGIAGAREKLLNDGKDLNLVPYWSSFLDHEDRSRVRLLLRVIPV